jgi:hypothetical protein
MPLPRRAEAPRVTAARGKGAPRVPPAPLASKTGSDETRLIEQVIPAETALGEIVRRIMADSRLAAVQF